MKLLHLTYNEKNLHCNVTDGCAPSCGQVLIANETHVVRYCHSNIKCCQQNEPVPASFESAEMQQNELGFFCIRNLILWKCWFIYKHVLWIKTQRRGAKKHRLEMETELSMHSTSNTLQVTCKIKHESTVLCYPSVIQSATGFIVVLVPQDSKWNENPVT